MSNQSDFEKRAVESQKRLKRREFTVDLFMVVLGTGLIVIFIIEIFKGLIGG